MLNICSGTFTNPTPQPPAQPPTPTPFHSTHPQHPPIFFSDFDSLSVCQTNSLTPFPSPCPLPTFFQIRIPCQFVQKIHLPPALTPPSRPIKLQIWIVCQVVKECTYSPPPSLSPSPPPPPPPAPKIFL